MDGQDPGPSRPRPHVPNRGSQTRPPAGPPHCGKTDCGIRAVNAGCRHPPAPGPWPQHIWTLARCCWPRAQWQKAFPGDYSKVSWEGSSSTQIPNRRPEAGAGPKNPTPRSLFRAHPVAGEPCSRATPPCSLPGHCKLPESQESPVLPRPPSWHISSLSRKARCGRGQSPQRELSWGGIGQMEAGSRGMWPSFAPWADQATVPSRGR